MCSCPCCACTASRRCRPAAWSRSFPRRWRSRTARPASTASRARGRRAGHADRAGQARLRRRARADPAAADAAGRPADRACGVELAGGFRSRRQRAAPGQHHPAHRYGVGCRGRSDSARARERGRARAHADAARRRQDRAARRSAARVRRYAHEFDPAFRRESGRLECARWSRISIRRSKTAATPR